MSDQPDIKEFTEALSTPLGDLIAAVGKGVAEAQQALDEQVLNQFIALAKTDSETQLNLRKMGYQPTWYQIPEANAELMIALSIDKTGANVTKTGQNNTRIYAAPVNATYLNSYDYSLKSFSSVKFKVVPVPPSPDLEQMQLMPDVIGLSVSDAAQILNSLNIQYQYSENDVTEDRIIVSTSNPIDSFVGPGDVVLLTLEASNN